MPFLPKLALINELKKIGMTPDKTRGQCFLININACKKMVEFLDFQGNQQRVMEVGAGFGAFSSLIAPYCSSYFLVDNDPNCAKYLAKNFQKESSISYFQSRHIQYLGTYPEKSRINIIEADILAIPWPHVDFIISNLPFNITYPFFIKLLKNWNYQKAVLILQSDVVETLYSKPGDAGYGILSLLFQLFFHHIKKPFKLARTDFFPKPDVTCEIVEFLPKSELLEGSTRFIHPQLREEFITFVEILFKFKFKQFSTLFHQCKSKFPFFLQSYPRFGEALEKFSLKTKTIRKISSSDIYFLFLDSRMTER